MPGVPAIIVEGAFDVLLGCQNDLIEVVRETGDPRALPRMIGLRDPPLIAAKFFALARVWAVVAMTFDDYYSPGAGKVVAPAPAERHEMPAHHTLEEYLDAELQATVPAARHAGLARAGPVRGLKSACRTLRIS
jgi:hypothetical protein